jgi:hypothetical protein
LQPSTNYEASFVGFLDGTRIAKDWQFATAPASQVAVAGLADWPHMSQWLYISTAMAEPPPMSTEELRHLAKTMRQAPLVTRLLWEIRRLRGIARQAEVLRRMLGSQPKGLYQDGVSIALERLSELLENDPAALEERQHHAELIEGIKELKNQKPRGRDPRR